MYQQYFAEQAEQASLETMQYQLNRMIQIAGEVQQTHRLSLESASFIQDLPEDLLPADAKRCLSQESIAESFKSALQRVIDAVVKLWGRVVEWTQKLFGRRVEDAEKTKEQADKVEEALDEAIRRQTAEAQKHSDDIDKWHKQYEVKKNPTATADEQLARASTRFTEVVMHNAGPAKGMRVIYTRLPGLIATLKSDCQTIAKAVHDPQSTDVGVNKRVFFEAARELSSITGANAHSGDDVAKMFLGDLRQCINTPSNVKLKLKDAEKDHYTENFTQAANFVVKNRTIPDDLKAINVIVEGIRNDYAKYRSSSDQQTLEKNNMRDKFLVSALNDLREHFAMVQKLMEAVFHAQKAEQRVIDALVAAIE